MPEFSNTMTGIQALERAMSTLPMKRGRPEKTKFEYISHEYSLLFMPTSTRALS